MDGGFLDCTRYLNCFGDVLIQLCESDQQTTRGSAHQVTATVSMIAVAPAAYDYVTAEHAVLYSRTYGPESPVLVGLRPDLTGTPQCQEAVRGGHELGGIFSVSA